MKSLLCCTKSILFSMTGTSKAGAHHVEYEQCLNDVKIFVNHTGRRLQVCVQEMKQCRGIVTVNKSPFDYVMCVKPNLGIE